MLLLKLRRGKILGGWKGGMGILRSRWVGRGGRGGCCGGCRRRGRRGVEQGPWEGYRLGVGIGLMRILLGG